MMIEQMWKDLSEIKEEGTGTGYFVRRLELGKKYSLTAAVDIQTKSKSIMILLDLPSIKEIQTALSVKGLSLEVHEDRFGIHLKIMAADSRFEDMFVLFANDLIKAVDHAKGRPLKEVLLQRLTRWQEFFKQGGESGMRREKQIGLFGELVCMQVLLESGFECRNVLMGWCGPDGYPHDFKIGTCDIEVKTSAVRSGKVQISNEFQLDSLGEVLYLAHLDVDARYKGGVTLPEIIGQLRVIFEEVNLLDIFFDKLLATGYIEAQQSLYEVTHYSYSDFVFYLVDSDFPRITPGQLPVGICNVKYQLQLSTCAEWIIQFNNVMESLKGGV